MSNYPELNEIEQRAVNWNTGPLLVLADGNVSRRSVVSYRMERFFKESRNISPFIIAPTDTCDSIIIVWRAQARSIGRATQRVPSSNQCTESIRKCLVPATAAIQDGTTNAVLFVMLTPVTKSTHGGLETGITAV